MFKRILVSTDRSELSTKAIQAAIELARDHGAKLIGMTVVAPYRYAGMAGCDSQDVNGHHAKSQHHAVSCLRELRTAAQQASVPCEVVTKETNTPWEGIVAVAQEQSCDLIVMATRVRSGLEAMLGKSQTQEVMRHTDVPVLVYR